MPSSHKSRNFTIRLYPDEIKAIKIEAERHGYSQHAICRRGILQIVEELKNKTPSVAANY